MNRFHIAGCFIILTLLTGCAWGDELVWDHAQGTVWNNFYTSPYYARDNSLNAPQGTLLQIFCLDYNDEIAPPYTWQANLSELVPGNIQNFQFGGSYPGALATPFAFQGDANPVVAHAVTMAAGSDAYHRYLEAAWLFSNILAAITDSNPNTSIISQVAAWDLFVDQNHIADLAGRIEGTGGTWALTNYVDGAPLSISGLTFRSAVDEAVKAAQSAVLGGWLPTIGWSVVTGDAGWVQTSHGGVRAQEFLTPFVATPEPSALILLMTAILLVAFFGSRRLQLRKQ